MAYTLHVSGTQKTVTVARAQQFQKETGNKISSGYNNGGWFCFTFPFVKNKAKDIAALEAFFPNTLIETVKERSARNDAWVAANPQIKGPIWVNEIHALIAKGIVAANPGKRTCDLRDEVGVANRAYGKANNLEHNAHDYYAVQGEIMKLLGEK